MKKFVFIVCLTIVSQFVFAQENIKNEILSFTDSTEIIIQNGRKLIVDKTVSGDHKSAIATLNFLKENVDERYIILYPAEEILVSLATRNFELFLYNAKNFNSLLEGKVRTFQMASISEEIHQYLGKEILFIADEIQGSILPETEKEVLQIYIRYYLNENNTDLNKYIKNFQKNHPKSEYSDFLNELKSLTTTGRMNFCFGYGNEFLQGNFTENFDSHMHIMNFEMDGFINRLYLSLIMGGSISREVSKNEMPVKKKDWIHSEGEKISTLKYGLKIGKSVYSTNKLNFYPYLFIGGYEVNSQSSEFEDLESSDPKNNLSGSFCTGIGASCDFVVKKWEPRNIYNPESFLFIRPSIGYDYFITNKDISKGGDLYFTISMGISLGGIQ